MSDDLTFGVSESEAPLDPLAEAWGEIDRLRGIVNTQKADGGWRGHRRRLLNEIAKQRWVFGKVLAERDIALAQVAAVLALCDDRDGLVALMGFQSIVFHGEALPAAVTTDAIRGTIASAGQS